MKILVLNGSPRPNGNTAKMVGVFREVAEKNGHEVVCFNVCKMNIKGCLACEYCHGKGQGSCVQKDDMQEIYKELKDTEMLVLAAPIYYHGISGQLKCVVDRFYSALYPTAPEGLRKTECFLVRVIPICMTVRNSPMTVIFSAILAWRAAVFSQTMIMMYSAKSGKWLIRCNGGISCNTNVK